MRCATRSPVEMIDSYFDTAYVRVKAESRGSGASQDERANRRVRGVLIDSWLITISSLTRI